MASGCGIAFRIASKAVHLCNEDEPIKGRSIAEMSSERHQIMTFLMISQYHSPGRTPAADVLVRLCAC